MNMWERLQNIDPRWYYYLLVLVVALPIIKPWGLPIKVGPEARSFYETVEALPQGSTIFLCVGYRTDSVVEMDPQLGTFFKQALDKGLKVIAWAAVDEGAMVAQTVLGTIAEERGAVYGKDWINLGFKPISDALLQKMIDDFHQAMAYSEIGGGSLDSFEITKNFHSIKQAELIVCLSNVTPSPGERMIRMISIPTGLPIVMGTGSVSVPGEMPYYASGQYKGLLAGLRGAAEYELLTDYPGSAILGMDAQSAAHFLVIALIAIGNIGFFLTRKGR